MSQNNVKQTKRYVGGCHCGAVRFEADLDLSTASRCNCTLCVKRSATGLIVKPAAFRLVSREESLAAYSWASKTGTYYFCPKCGIHVFGRGSLPQLGGEYVSVNVNCIDDLDPATLKVVYWDGRHDNWFNPPEVTSYL